MTEVEFLDVGYIQTQHKVISGNLYTELGITISNEKAEELKNKGWKVRDSWWNDKTSSFEGNPWLLLSCPSGNGFDVPKGDIRSVDIVVHPVPWEVGKYKGVKLFAKSVHFNLKE